MHDLFLTVVAALTGTGIAAALLAWLLGKWIGARIDASIKAEYDRLKVKYENELRRRERAQLVAELLAEWMSTPVDGGMPPEQRKRINKLSFEATLWLPEEIAVDLSSRPCKTLQTRMDTGFAGHAPMVVSPEFNSNGV